MPIYEYYCKSCNDSFEVRQAIDQMEEGAACPEGHGGAQKKLSMFASVVSGGDCGMPAASMGGCGAPACCINPN